MIANRTCRLTRATTLPWLTAGRLLMATGILLLACGASSAGPVSAAAKPDAEPRFLAFQFSSGEVVIELAAEAAPSTVDRLRQALAERVSSRSTQGPLRMEQIWSQIEVSTGLLLPESELIAQEIDAESLGLDQDLIETTGEAIDVLQFELAIADTQWKRDGTRPALYQKWLDEFLQTSSPNQMLGVSRKQINQVLGYRYVSGLDSREAKRGAVYLKPATLTENQLALTVLLSDRPQLTGRVTVIGQVVKGLDLLRELSTEPTLIQFGRPTKTPVEPPEITAIDLRTTP